jgi:hypothetical protein
MKYKKQELLEIIDSNGDLIGKNDVPTTGADLETAANNTTDYNAKIGTQPYRYDFLGRMGFLGMPFMEGEEDHNGGEAEVANDLAQFVHELRLELLKYYFKNPNKLKPDYRKLGDQDSEWKNMTAEDKKDAQKILKIVNDNFEMTYGKQKNITEAAVVEDKVVDKRGEDEISTRGDDREMHEKKLEKIAGLINKLEKKDLDKLINLLERKK